MERTVLSPGEIELHVRNDGADPVRDASRRSSTTASPRSRQSKDEIGRLGGADDEVELPLDRGRGLRGAAAHLHRRDDRPRDRGRRRDAGGRPRLLRPDGADRPLRGRDPGGDRHALAALGCAAVDAALDALPARLHRRPARLPRDRGAARGHRARGRGARGARRRARWSGSARRAPTWPWRAWMPGCAGARGAATRRTPPSDRRRVKAGALGDRAALLVALGIGLHNLGEGLAIGSAYAIGSLALGAALVVGFALHNTTEGLAIVAPVARDGRASAAARWCCSGCSPARPPCWAPGSAPPPSTRASPR